MKHVEYLEKNEVAKQYAFSPAVVTEGGRVVWLSGQIARRDASGNDITGQFEPQVRRIFTLMEQTTREAGGHSLADLVTMTGLCHRHPLSGAVRRDTPRTVQGCGRELSGEHFHRRRKSPVPGRGRRNTGHRRHRVRTETYEVGLPTTTPSRKPRGDRSGEGAGRKDCVCYGVGARAWPAHGRAAGRARRRHCHS